MIIGDASKYNRVFRIHFPHTIDIVASLRSFGNDGLLVGATILQRPDLFREALPAVGVLDMLRYHKFTIGWAWATDYSTSEESKEMCEYLYKYSPLHNVKSDVKYPAVLVTTSFATPVIGAVFAEIVCISGGAEVGLS